MFNFFILIDFHFFLNRMQKFCRVFKVSWKVSSVFALKPIRMISMTKSIVALSSDNDCNVVYIVRVNKYQVAVRTKFITNSLDRKF